MNKYERVEKLLEAQTKIDEAIDLIHEAFPQTEKSRLDAYICGHLKGWSHGTNPYDSTAIPRLIEQIEREELEEDDECDDEDATNGRR